MMVFFKERLVYLAVPKTGTSAIERALHRRASAVLREPPGLKHTNARSYERRFRALFEQGDLAAIESVAMMREPVSWLGSWYRYRQRPALSGHKNSTDGISFDQFVESYLRDLRPPYADIGSQGRFVTDENNDLLINHLFRYEDMPTFTDFLQKKLGTEISFPAVNTSPKGDVTLSNELRDALKRAYPLDFQIYDALTEGPLSIS